MNRREFWLSGSSLVALATTAGTAFAQTADPAQLLQTTLTPFGAERAGNADGTIPAWTGGLTTVPSSWDPATQMIPDLFADDKVLFTINASNMAQYADKLTESCQHMIQNSGYVINVYQTRRTAAAPQWVYDNTAANVKTAQLNPGGGRLGFTGAFGGIPFPIPNISDPYAAGAQIMINHEQKWNGVGYRQYAISWSITQGQKAVSAVAIDQYYFPYYDQRYTLATYPGLNQDTHEILLGPGTQVGLQIITRYASDPLTQPDITWELLQGQGRVRKAPEVFYDTPSSQADDIANYDEYNGFSGPMNEYDWKYIGKKEIYVPYNCAKLSNTSSNDAIGPKFLNPDVVRWELHRVWVVEATLHPGERNDVPRRVFYFDEDSWYVLIADGYDANGNIEKRDVNYLTAFPQVPCMFGATDEVTNLQTGDYAFPQGSWNDPPANRPIYFGNFPSGTFDPQEMAAAASY